MVVTRHHAGVAEEEERTGDEGHVEDVHTRTTEDFLGEDDAEGHGQGEHPQGGGDGDDEGDDDTAHEVTLGNLLLLPLSHDELDAQTHDVAHGQVGQKGQEAIEEEVPHAHRTSILPGGQRILVTNVVAAEEQGGHECHHHETHQTLAVEGIVHVDGAAAACGMRHESKALKALIHAAEGVQFATLLEGGLYVIKEFSKRFHN